MLAAMSPSVGPGPRSIVFQRGRPKVYRPLPPGERRAALDAGLDAYARDEWFLAHELLEPAWMGTADPWERDLYQGLIKLAAAHVHRQRGNPIGLGRHLAGARVHLVAAIDGGVDAAGLDLPAIVAEIDRRLETLVSLGEAPLATVPAIVLESPSRRL
jgi:hypothetical protein